MTLLVTFNAELVELDDSHLLEKAAKFLEREEYFKWNDSESTGIVCDVSWRGLHQILRSDDIYFGGSRMIELLLGAYRHDVDYDVEGDWTPAEGRPLHATWVDRVSLVAWRSSSEVASSKKAQHFKRVVARAADQLPGDRPGAIHVGYETLGGSSPDLRRHLLNKEAMRSFEPGDSRLRYVYGNYFMPEHTTHQNESCAVSETMAWYPIGRSGTREPLKGHMLFDDLDGLPGMHFQS